ncbi:MAG: hypothetical protein GY909_13370 [Oligoflexia bacterium]|nr:hypothetical protein [Oligoflexia bacterium]
MFGIDTSSFMPHGHCILWSAEILVPMLIGETLTILSYFLIPVGIFKFMNGRSDITKDIRVILYLFILFILFCGFTHLISTWNYWHSDYVLEMIFKVLTGLVSVTALVVLYKHIPDLIKLPSPAQHQQLVIDNEEMKTIFESVTEGIVLYRPVYKDGKVVDFDLPLV